jgi:hypothetical protein
MRHGLSERYCGEVVQTNECSFEDGKRIVIICPECRQPMFLRGDCFLHFPSKGSNPHLCEDSVKNYNKHDISARRIEARNRRLLTIQENYLEMLESCPTSHSYASNWRTRETGVPTDPFLLELVPIWRSSIFAYISREGFFNSALNNFKKVIMNWLSALPPNDPTTIHINRKLSKIKSKIDLRMHIFIYSEFLFFACDPSQKDLLISMMAESFLQTAESLLVFGCNFDIANQNHVELWHRSMLDCLLVVAWAEEFLKHSPTPKTNFLSNKAISKHV